MQAEAKSYQSSYFEFDPKKRAVSEVRSNLGIHKSNSHFYLNEKTELLTSSVNDEKESNCSFVEYHPNLEVTPFVLPAMSESFIEIKKWEGKITAVDLDKEIFWASIRDDRSPDIEEETYFSFDDINETDQHLIAEGAIFYWSIGYKRTISGGREKVSILLFRRLPAWNIDKEKAEENLDALNMLFSNEQA
jgi:hypothetical protein